MKQWNSGDRAATSVVAEVLCLRLIARAILGSLYVTRVVFVVLRFGSIEILVLWRITKEARILLLLKNCDRES